MATDPKKLPALGALPASAFEKGKKGKRPADRLASAGRPAPAERLSQTDTGRSRPAPALGVTRAKKPRGVQLFQRYGIVFDPEAESDPITKRERDALLDLYREQTGRELDTEPDVRGALERSGLLGTGRERGGGSALRSLRGREFTSAADAIDFLTGPEATKVMREAVQEVLPSGTGALLAAEATGGREALVDYVRESEPFYEAPVVRFAAGELARGARALDEFAEPVTRPVADVVNKGISDLGATVGEMIGEARTTPGGRAIERLGRAVAPSVRAGLGAAGRGVAESASPMPTAQSFAQLSGVGVQGAYPAYEQPTLSDVSDHLSDVSDQFVDMAENPEKYVSTTVDINVETEFPDAPEWFVEKIAQAKRGGTPGEIGLVDVDEKSPFSAEQDEVMRVFARRNGWDTTEWAGLTINDKIYRAVNRKDNAALFWRSFVRGIGEIGAAPAGMKAVVSASADAIGGDTEQAEMVIEAAFAPYVQTSETYKRRGFWAALGEFIRDNPIDAVFIASTAARATSRGLGTAARAGAFGQGGRELAQRGREVTVAGPSGRRVPQRPVPVPEPELPPIRSAPDLLEQVRVRDAERRRVAEQNRAAQEDYLARRRRYEETGEMEEFTVPVAIGRVGRGLAGAAFLQYVKAPIAARFPSYRDRISRRMSYREQRLSGNVAQGEDIAVRQILERALGRGADEKTRARAVFELIFPAVDYDGNAITPSYVADFYRAEKALLEQQLKAAKGPERFEDTQFRARLDEAIARYDEMETVRLDPEVSARLRAEAKRLGEVNDQRFAKMMGVSLAEAKRGNYIRVLAMDRARRVGMEAEAKSRQASRNAAIRGLRRSQKRIVTLSRQVQERASESGWGKAGPARSRLRFNAVRSDLVAELRRAEKFAKQYGDDELAASYRQSRLALAAGRLATRTQRDAASRMLDDIANVRLSDEAIARLPEDVRVAYEEAVPLARAAERLESEQRATLERAGVRKTTTRTMTQAEERVLAANDDLNAYSELPNPDPSVVAKKELKLQREMEKRDAIAQAEALKPRVRAAQKRRDDAIRRTIDASNKKVLDLPTLRAALDQTEQLASVEVKGRKDLFWQIKRVRNEVLDEFIARVEALDMNPVLHLVQTPDYKRVGEPIVFEGNRLLEAGPRGFISKGRFKSSDGFLFVSAEESARTWDNLLRNTSEVTTASVLQQRLNDLVVATSIPFRFSNDAIVEAKRIAAEDEGLLARVESGDLTVDGAEREALARVLRDPEFVGERADINIVDFVVLNLAKASAKRPTERLSFGGTRADNATGDLGVFAMRTIDERSLDPNAPGTYYLMPRAVYNGIQKAIADESFRFKETGPRIGARAERIVKLWRTITLNVLPRTAINNTIGSTILAIQAGAGPRAFWYAANALAGRRMMIDGERRALPVPPELRQRYYEQLTDPIARRRKSGSFAEPTPLDYLSSWAGWWMNSMRTFNGLSEDFGRLAVWYQQAYPAAMRDAGARRFFLSAQSLNNTAVDMLESMARREENYRALTDEFIQKSFDFLGDLHKGGRTAATIRIAIPFYQWYAHMLKLTFFTMPVKYPGRGLFIQMLSDIGRDYQEQHGISLPWGQEFVPFSIVEAEVSGRQQEIVQGYGLGGWWPGATISPIGSETGDLRGLDFLTSAVTPVWSNSALILLSLASIATGGSAKEISDEDWLMAAKDEYGLEIERDDTEAMIRYFSQKLFRMFPLSPTIMSQAGRASTALPIPGLGAQRKTETLQLPEEVRQEQRADVLSLIDDWRANLPAMLLKIGVGLPVNYMPGRGPVSWQRWERDYKFGIDQKSREDKAIADALREIHMSESLRDAPPIIGRNQ